jgi:hypothetical protein
MCGEAIRQHFKRRLGHEVDVSFLEPDDPSKVILYRPTRLRNVDVRSAYEDLLAQSPAVALRIEYLVVSYEENRRLKWQGVKLE